MNYEEIKKNLCEARRLIDAGDIAAADAKIRAMVGKGLTRMDLDANLTDADFAKLRDHAMKATTP
jgi:hypothetical protein